MSNDMAGGSKGADIIASKDTVLPLLAIDAPQKGEEPKLGVGLGNPGKPWEYHQEKSVVESQ